MEKKYKNGLVLGKFMPVHLGHQFLINTASEQCENVTVLICSLKTEPIPGHLRYEWLKELYSEIENVNIIHCEDENPQVPEESESIDSFYNDYWCPSVYSRIKELDAVFTSEYYGDEFASYLKVEHVLVDLERKTYPVSGTKVRNNAYEMWNYIPKNVKHYYIKKIAIVGPESTGKSTLTKYIGKYFNVPIIEEYGRTYTESIKNANDLESEDFFIIADTHNTELIEKSKLGAKYLISDTEAIVTKTFKELYLDSSIDERIETIIQKQDFDIYLLMDIDIPWVDDNTRDFPNSRKKHFDLIESELIANNKRYIVINGSYKEREEKVINIILNL